MPESLDMNRAVELLEEAIAMCHQLNGRDLNDPTKDKDRAARKAETARLLQMAAHVADAGRIEINSQYMRFRGESDVPVTRLG